jgi:hypothetical protein
MLQQLKWKHVFIIVIITSALLGIALGTFFIKKDISPRQFIRDIFTGGDGALGPVRAADAYLSAWETIQPLKMFQQLTRAEQAATEQKTYVKDFEDFPLRPMAHKKISWSRTGDKAFVKMLVTWPTLDGQKFDKEEYIMVVKEGVSWRVSEKDSFK